jgi:hypothetical protein
VWTLAAGARLACSAAALAALPAPTRAQTPPPAPPGAEVEAGDGEGEDDTPAEGFVLPAGTEALPPLVLMGYLDVGFADAQGNGTSLAGPDDGTPADYHVDFFAPMVNSRGDVASTETGGRVTHGFLPRSVAIAGKPSFLLNTASFDLRYQAPRAPVMAFTRLQVLPRFGGDGRGNQTWVFLEQAFGRVTPFEGHELFVSLGKFDSVFGIEYLEREAPFRTGITPSLLARYTTGTSIGAKVFYRQQIAPLWSALSLNFAATNSGTMIEALQPPDASLTGRPVLAARLGYELALPALQIKLGASGLRGPRNDQHERSVPQKMYGADGRLTVAGFTLAGEYVHVEKEETEGAKQTGMGTFPATPEFYAHGFWAQGSYALAIGRGPLRAITGYGRYERRHAYFEGFTPITVARVTGGVRLDLWESFILKAEMLFNRELEGAPTVKNDVFTSSAVYSW